METSRLYIQRWLSPGRIFCEMIEHEWHTIWRKFHYQFVFIALWCTFYFWNKRYVLRLRKKIICVSTMPRKEIMRDESAEKSGIYLHIMMKDISLFPRRHYFSPKRNSAPFFLLSLPTPLSLSLSLSFSLSLFLSLIPWIDTNRTEIHFINGRKLFRVADEVSMRFWRWLHMWSRIGLEAERNRLIKMLIARLVRRPPVMSARSSAGVALRGVREYLLLNLRPFSRFPFLSFFIYFDRLFIARWIVYATTWRIWIMFSLFLSLSLFRALLRLKRTNRHHNEAGIW